MKIDFIPENFTPVEQGLIFGFSTESDTPQDVEVEIIDAQSDEVIATQLLLRVISAAVNIAPYVERFEKRAPISCQEAASHLEELEVARYKIRIAGVESDEVVVAPLRCEVVTPDIITVMPQHRKIACEGCDELIFAVEEGAIVEVQLLASDGESLSFAKQAESGLLHCVVAPTDFAEGVTSITLQIYLNGEEWRTLEYEIVPQRRHAMQVAWVSSTHGTIERYIFPILSSWRNGVDKQRMGEGAKLKAVAATISNSIKLRSDYEPQATIAALADIVAAPKVWVEFDGAWVQVDVLTSESGYNLFGEPDLVELEFGIVNRRELLW